MGHPPGITKHFPQRSPKNFPKTTPKGSSPSTSLKDLQRISKKLPKDALRTTPKGKPRLPPPRTDDLGNQDGIYNLKGASFVTSDNWRAQAFPKISQGSPQEVTQTSTPSNHHLSNSPILQLSRPSNSPTSQLPNSPTHPTFQILVTQIICSLGEVLVTLWSDPLGIFGKLLGVLWGSSW